MQSYNLDLASRVTLTLQTDGSRVKKKKKKKERKKKNQHYIQKQSHTVTASNILQLPHCTTNTQNLQ